MKHLFHHTGPTRGTTTTTIAGVAPTRTLASPLTNHEWQILHGTTAHGKELPPNTTGVKYTTWKTGIPLVLPHRPHGGPTTFRSLRRFFPSAMDRWRRWTITHVGPRRKGNPSQAAYTVSPRPPPPHHRKREAKKEGRGDGQAKRTVAPPRCGKR